MNKVFSRRDFARGAALTGVALPFLRLLGIDPFTPGIAHAGPTSMKRILFVFIPNGVVDWNADVGSKVSSETDFKLGKMTAPLESLKQDVVILDGVDMATNQTADTHTQGMVMFLTGHHFVATCNSTDDCVGGGGELGVGNASIDQHLAKKLGAATAFASVQLAAQPYQGFTMSFSGPGKGTAVPQNRDPIDAYKTLFGNLSNGPDPALVARLELRKSVLDSVTADLASLHGRLGADDRQKLDQHLTSVRAMESRLSAGGLTSACTKPTVNAISGNLQNAASYPAIIDAHNAVLFGAFACDLTRVATLQFRACYSTLNLPFAPLNASDDNIHIQSHNAFDNGAAGYAAFVKTKVWHYQKVAELATLLKKTPEADGSGSMLDNTLIVTGSDVSDGHTHKRMPWVTIGGKNLGVKTGRFLQYPKGTPHTRLLVSILNLMGVADTTFGNPAYASGPLTGFTA